MPLMQLFYKINRASHSLAINTALTSVLFLAFFCQMQALPAPPKSAKNSANKTAAANLVPIPTPEIRLPLLPLGYKPQLFAHLINGDSVRSLDFVDPNHLLLTYSLHDLIQRQPQCSLDDSQQIIQAVLLELPTGHVLARTNWGMCDTARYLWPLGRGRFLLRQGSQLSVISPLENLSSGNSLAPHNILHFGGAMMAINVSPDGRFLIVQYRVPTPAPSLEKLPGITTDGLGLNDINTRSISVNLYTLNMDAPGVNSIYATRFGDLKSANVLWIPMIEQGFLESTDTGSGKHWDMNLMGLTNTHTELAGIDTTCQPIANFLSDREYAAIICPPGDDQKSLAIYSLDVGLLWMEHFAQPFVEENISLAPQAGRFAMSVISTLYKTSHFEPVNADNTTGQWVRVYDTLTGAIRLTVEIKTIQLDGRNYTLAPDGRRLAVIGTDAIEVYSLPPLVAPKVAPVTTPDGPD